MVRLLVLLATCWLAAFSAGAGAAPLSHRGRCDIVLQSLPARVDAPGRVCLADDHVLAAGSPAAIVVDSSNVVIDCRGHAIRNTTNAPGGIAIQVHDSTFQNPGLSDVTVRNCGIENFQYGILVLGTDAAVVPNRRITIQGNTIRKFMTGISIASIEAQVIGNVLDGDGKYYDDVDGRQYGIELRPSAINGDTRDTVVFDNAIYNLRANSAVGIAAREEFSSTSDGLQILHNRFYDFQHLGGSAAAIDGSGSDAILAENVFVALTSNQSNLGMIGAWENLTCLRNVVIGYLAPFTTQCSNGSGQVVIP